MSVRPVHFGGMPVAPWIRPRLVWARKHGWTGKVSSGWRSPAAQERLWADKLAGRITWAVARPGTSNHEGLIYPRGAVDLTEPDEFARAMRAWPGRGPILIRGIATEPWHFSATGR